MSFCLCYRIGHAVAEIQLRAMAPPTKPVECTACLIQQSCIESNDTQTRCLQQEFKHVKPAARRHRLQNHVTLEHGWPADQAPFRADDFGEGARLWLGERQSPQPQKCPQRSPG